MTGSGHLKIYGAGTLSEYLVPNWKWHYPNARVLVETETPSRHDRLRRIGAEPSLSGDGAMVDGLGAAVFAVPPSVGTDAYSRALGRFWTETQKTGARRVFISSTGVIAEELGEWVDEESPTAPLPPYGDLLLQAEADARGQAMVIRPAGLYHDEKGLHRHYLRQPAIAGNPEAWVNSLHYEDLASVCVAALGRKNNDGLWIASDGNPVTRREFAARSWEWARGKRLPMLTPEPAFTAKASPELSLGKRCKNDKVRTDLRWSPKWESFLRRRAPSF